MNQIPEHVGHLIATAIPLFPRFVPFNRLQVFLLHERMPESTDRYVEKVLEGYGSTDTGPLRDLLKLLEEGFSFPMQEGFARQKAKRKMRCPDSWTLHKATFSSTSLQCEPETDGCKPTKDER